MDANATARASADYFDALHELQQMLGDELLLQLCDHLNGEPGSAVDLSQALFVRIGNSDEALATLSAAVKRLSAAYVACGPHLAQTSGTS